VFIPMRHHLCGRTTGLFSYLEKLSCASETTISFRSGNHGSCRESQLFLGRLLLESFFVGQTWSRKPKEGLLFSLICTLFELWEGWTTKTHHCSSFSLKLSSYKVLNSSSHRRHQRIRSNIFLSPSNLIYNGLDISFHLLASLLNDNNAYIYFTRNLFSQHAEDKSSTRNRIHARFKTLSP
jgi:hypothetical protein